MTAISATTADFANEAGSDPVTSFTQSGHHMAIAERLKKLWPGTAEVLATMFKVVVRTAKRKLSGEREFTLDEIVKLLHDRQGYEILSVIMQRAEVKPHWWLVCEPLMELASIEQMQIVVRERVLKAVESAAHAHEQTLTEIRRAQTQAVHDQEFHQPRIDALQYIARASRGVVEPTKRGK